MSPNDSYSQHVVTAVIVAHDGAGWLARGLDALNEQTRPVQRIVAVDTGSRDRSGALLTAQLGQGAVFGMDRSTGYAAAVRRAIQHKAASTQVGGQQGRARTDQVEWLWLLHDDCEPAADALEQLLRGAAETPNAAVLGPKLMDWSDRDVIVEAGIALDTAGRRVSGIEQGEVDQGQHDGDRDTLAVSSAGMLVRRDVWEHVGGFDPGMTLFGEDIDFCWRVHGAGYRVRVVTDAVVFHAQAAARGRRAISVGRRARLLERRNGLLTLLANLPIGPMVSSALGNLTLSLVRTLFYMVAKRPAAALDESAAVLGVLGHPLRLASARRRRSRGRRSAYSRLRADLPPGRSLRRVAEFAALIMARSSGEDQAKARHATDDPTDDDSLLTDTGFVQRLLTRPGVLLVLGLIVVTIAAERSLVTAGTLAGGALLPAWEGASSLWAQFLQGFHPTGVGSSGPGLPYVGLLALLSTVLGGKPWLAIDVLLLGCVPLAGVTSFLALRRVTTSVPVRLWAAAAYSLLPVAFGAIAAGRLGSAVAFALIPLIGLLAGRMFSQPAKLARRAAWATGFVIAVGTAFVPLLWPIALAAAALAGVTLWRSRPALLANLAIVVLTPVVLLLPWMLQLLPHPSGLLLEAGVQQQGLADATLAPRSLLLLSPGGPGLPPYWVSGALLLAALAALLTSRRRRLIVVGWCVAVLGFATALGVSRVTVTVADGQVITPWPGVALAVAAAGVILAAAAAGDGLGGRKQASGRARARRVTGARGLSVVVLALVACSAPALAAAYWVMNGVSGPIGPAAGEVVPPLVSVAGASGLQSRTLVLQSSGGHISYMLLRGQSPLFGDPGLKQDPAAQAALSKTVAALVAPGGGEAVNQSQALARFDIGFVLMRAPANQQLVNTLDAVSGLTQMTMTQTFDLWKLSSLPARVSVLEPSGAVVTVHSGSVGLAGAAVPATGGILELAEPAGGWTAAVDGHGLTPVASPAGSWAQAFKLPPGGGKLTVSRSAPVHDALTVLELVAFIVVAALALPGVRTAAEMQAAAATVQTDGRPKPEADSATGAEHAGSAAHDAEQTAVVRPGAVQPDAVPPDAARPDAARPDAARPDAARPDAARPSGRGRRIRRGKLASAKLAGKNGRREGPQPDKQQQEAGKPGQGGRIRGLPLPSRGGKAAAADGATARPAWPAGQPVSRFMGGPASGRFRPVDPGYAGQQRDDEPYRGHDGWEADGPAWADSGHRSPTGTPFDEPEGRGRTRRGYPLSPSGAPYDEPVRGAARSPSGAPYDVPGDRERAGYGYEDEHANRSRRDNRGERDYGRERGYPPRSAASQGTGWRDDSATAGWPQDRQHASPGDQGSPGQTRRWQQGQQHGWPQDYPQPGHGAGWQVPDQPPWPDESGPLEALPPDEVHHDWPSRDDRAARNWPAPRNDGEGETW